MKILIATTLTLALALLPMVAADASGGVSCHYFASESASYLVIHDATGLPFRAHDFQGALRASGVASSANFMAPVAGPMCDALVLTIGNESICVYAENDDIWQ
jgi:hypothetical protein